MPPEVSKEDQLREALRAGQKEKKLTLPGLDGKAVFEQFFKIKFPDDEDNVRPLRPDILSNGFNLTPDPKRVALLDQKLSEELNDATVIIPALLDEQIPRAQRAEEAIRKGALLALIADEALMVEDTRTGKRKTRLEEIQALYDKNIANTAIGPILAYAKLSRRIDHLQGFPMSPAIAAMYLSGMRGISGLLKRNAPSRADALIPVSEEIHVINELVKCLRNRVFTEGAETPMDEQGATSFIVEVFEEAGLDEERKAKISNYMQEHNQASDTSKLGMSNAILEAAICTSFDWAEEGKTKSVAQICSILNNGKYLANGIAPVVERNIAAVEAVEALILKTVRLSANTGGVILTGMPVKKGGDRDFSIIGREEIETIFREFNRMLNGGELKEAMPFAMKRLGLPAAFTKAELASSADKADAYFKKTFLQVAKWHDAATRIFMESIGEISSDGPYGPKKFMKARRELEFRHGLIAGIMINQGMLAMRAESRDSYLLSYITDERTENDPLLQNKARMEALHRLHRFTNLLPFLRVQLLTIKSLFMEEAGNQKLH